MLLSCLIVFSAGSIDASAALSDGAYLTPSEARAVFGETLSVTFFDGSDYVDTTASYFGKYAIQRVFSETTYDSVYAGAEALVYQVNISATTSDNVSYVTVRARPRYSIIGTSQLHTWIGCVSNSTIGTVFQSPAWDWTIGHFENHDLAEVNSGTRAYLRLGGSVYSFVPVDYSSQSEFSTYCTDATFFGNRTTGGLFIAIGIPYVDSDSTAESGTNVAGAGGSGGSGGNVNVNIDLSETNEELATQTGIFNSILAWIGQFFNELSSTVRSWFIPSQNFFENWIDELMDVITDHFLPHLPLNGQIENIASDLAAALGEGGVQAVNFPAISVPGTDFSMPSYSVPLVPSGMEDSIEYLKLMIDCLCTVWVFNMVLNRIHAIIVGETSVEVIDDVD